MISKTTELILKKFGCLRCQSYRAAEGGRGSKVKCARDINNPQVIRYLKRCPKR